jgi:hypothetical protein
MSGPSVRRDDENGATPFRHLDIQVSAEGLCLLQIRLVDKACATLSDTDAAGRRHVTLLARHIRYGVGCEISGGDVPEGTVESM